jgi:hypothetical protein
MKTEITNHLTPAQLELLEMAVLNDTLELAEEIMLIHDIALYHSDYCINSKEKTALYQLKQFIWIFFFAFLE